MCYKINIVRRNNVIVMIFKNNMIFYKVSARKRKHPHPNAHFKVFDEIMCVYVSFFFFIIKWFTLWEFEKRAYVETLIDSFTYDWEKILRGSLYFNTFVLNSRQSVFLFLIWKMFTLNCWIPYVLVNKNRRTVDRLPVIS